MNRFANICKNEQGISMIELLGTLVIVSVAAVSMYGVLTMGLKTYQKITIEAKLRDEADYVVSMIMNKLYSSDYDDVKYDDITKSIEFYKRKEDKPFFQNDDVTYDDSFFLAARLHIQDGEMRFEELDQKGDIQKTVSFTQSSSIKLKPITSNAVGSNLGVACTKQNTIFPRIDGALHPTTICKSGILQLTFIFEAEGTDIKPLTVTSEIGF
jgi:hypothetical protein